MTLRLSPAEWDMLSRERKVLDWIGYWLDWAEERGITELVSPAVPVLDEELLALVEEVRSARRGRSARKQRTGQQSLVEGRGDKHREAGPERYRDDG